MTHPRFLRGNGFPNIQKRKGIFVRDARMPFARIHKRSGYHGRNFSEFRLNLFVFSLPGMHTIEDGSE
jgi:hypothetical protein